MNDALDIIERGLALVDERTMRELTLELEHLAFAVDEFDRLVQESGIGSVDTLTARANVVIRARVLRDRFRKAERAHG